MEKMNENTLAYPEHGLRSKKLFMTFTLFDGKNEWKHSSLSGAWVTKQKNFLWLWHFLIEKMNENTLAYPVHECRSQKAFHDWHFLIEKMNENTLAYPEHEWQTKNIF